ncbi:MAG TPA: branched-chain amino acid ABC transporter permease [Candidatus Kapabacteria bacterium]|nr:branched-chain amino acid ABC transporter permease [Candidatus Kapabacteria bacterium]
MRPQLIFAIVFAMLVGLSFVTGQIDPYYYTVIIFIGINITMATSLNLINGFTGQFSLGHAGFMGVGAYVSAIVSTYLTTHGMAAAGTSGDLVLFVALILGGLAAALTGLAVGIPSLRLKGDYLAIVTLGFNEIIRVIIQNVDFKIAGTSYVGGARGFAVPQLASFLWVFGIALVTIYFVENLINSTYGRGFLAVRDDEVAAEAMGVNTTGFKVRAFVIGAFFAGIGGGLFAHFIQYITPDNFTFLKSIEIVVMVILGGMGSTYGVILAAIILTILPEALREFSEYRMIIYSLMLIVLMISRPQGLFGAMTPGKLFRKSKSSPQKV